MATLLSDNFDRANSTTVVGSPQVGPAPVVLTGTLGINANMLYAPVLVASQAIVVWDLGTPEVEVTALCAALSTSARNTNIVLGAASMTDFYLFVIDTATITLWKMSPGGYITLIQRPLPVANGATTEVRASYKAGIIRCYYGGLLYLQHEVSVPITSTRHGLRLNNVSTTNGKADWVLATDAPGLPVPSTNTTQPPDDLCSAVLALPDGSAYRGRDTKAQDLAGGS